MRQVVCQGLQQTRRRHLLYPAHQELPQAPVPRPGVHPFRRAGPPTIGRLAGLRSHPRPPLRGAVGIVGSTREVLNIVEWFEAGADIVTAVPNLIEGMLVHPYSKETVKMFLEDGKRLQNL